MTNLARTALLVLVPFAAGCSLSESSASLSASVESSSKIVSSPCESSSSSLKSSETRYREGVRDHTVSYVRSSESVESLQTQIADLARQHGLAEQHGDQSTR